MTEVGIVVTIHRYIEAMVATQIAGTMEKTVAQEISSFSPDSLDNILQCTYENARAGIFPIISNIVEQVILDLLRRDMIGKTPFEHISSYFDFIDAVNRVQGRLLLAYSFLA